jgi:cathepsin F
MKFFCTINQTSSFDQLGEDLPHKMSYRFVLLAALVTVAACIDLGLELVVLQEDLFREFVTKYDRNFGVDEYQTRLKIFSQNVQIIEKLNQMHNQSSVQYGINQFTDLSPEEFKQQKLMKFSSKRLHNGLEVLKEGRYVDSVPVNDLPEEFNWVEKGAVTPVKDQGSCGR